MEEIEIKKKKSDYDLIQLFHFLYRNEISVSSFDTNCLDSIFIGPFNGSIESCIKEALQELPEHNTYKNYSIKAIIKVLRKNYLLFVMECKVENYTSLADTSWDNAIMNGAT